MALNRTPDIEAPMLFLRTAAGGFVDAATIVRLVEETDGWVAICDDDRGSCLGGLLQCAWAA